MKANQHTITWKQKIALAVAGTLAIAVLLETALRVRDALRSRPPVAADSPEDVKDQQYFAIYDPDLLYRGNPKYPGHNSHGLFDYEVGAKRLGVPRVLFLGDSVGFFGDSYDDTMIGRVRNELQALRPQSPPEIINATMKGYGTYQELTYLKKYGLRFQPDQVGVLFCLNDLHKQLSKISVVNGQLVPETFGQNLAAIDQTRPFFERWSRRSRLLSWFKEKAPIVSNYFRWKASQGYSFDYHEVRRLAWQDEPWVEIESYLQEMKRLSFSNGFTLFVVVAPLAEQYQAEYLQRDREYVLKPQRKLAEICSRLAIPLFDPYAQLDASRFSPDGLHFSKPGRALMGKLIAQFWRQANPSLKSRQP